MNATDPRDATGRRRGRPRADQSSDARARLVEAARGLFAERGFAGTTVRAVASAAGLDPSLIRHYFGDKAGLLVASMELPVNPVELLRSVFELGPDGLGERIVGTFLTAWDPHREVFSALLRTTMSTAGSTAGSPAGADPPVVQMMRGVLVDGLTAVLNGPQPTLRAELVAAQVIGLASLRYVLAIEPLASADSTIVTSHYGAALQAVITPEGVPT